MLKKRKKKKEKKTDERNSIFKNVQICSMVDPCILTTRAFQFQGTIQNGPTYILIFVGGSNFEGTLLNQKNEAIKHAFIRMDLGMLPNLYVEKLIIMQAQLNNVEHCPK